MFVNSFWKYSIDLNKRCCAKKSWNWNRWEAQIHCRNSLGHGVNEKAGFTLKYVMRAPVDSMLQCAVTPIKGRGSTSVNSGENYAYFFFIYGTLKAAKCGVKILQSKTVVLSYSCAWSWVSKSTSRSLNRSVTSLAVPVVACCSVNSFC